MQNILLTLSYLIGLVLGVWLRVRKAKIFTHRKNPVPVGEKMLRGPGQSLSRFVEKKTEGILWIFITVLFIPVPFISALGQTHQIRLEIWFFVLLFVALFVLGYVMSGYLTKLLIRLNNAFLGLQGERFVGEILNHLMKDGYDVFHDYPLEPDGGQINLDHIVVGPTGVFAIETKTHRKPKEAADGKNYEVSFDGKELHFPHFKTTKGVDQAIHNARLLSKHLGASLDQPIRVTPILALPGWFVQSHSNNHLLVRNPKNIRSTIKSSDGFIDESLQRRISSEIDRRCRDVSF